jgi:H+/Na+-translocating ferredoxin:NAD+ oxidoreductase subunit C
VEGKPLVNRVVAVTGDALNSPKNIEARVGTPMNTVLDFCGGLKDNVTQVIMGGPMMGFSQFDISIPIVKATSGILCSGLVSETESKQYPCIRCNSCVTACPMFLLPNRLSRLIEKSFYEESDGLGILNCIECGSCVYVCPSNIPVLQWLRVGKYKVNELKRK